MEAAREKIPESTSMTSSHPSDAIKLRLVLTSDNFSPDEMTRRARLEFPRKWNRGDVVHSLAKNVHTQNGCMLEVTSSSLSRASQTIRQLLTPCAEALSALPPGIDVELSCIVQVTDGSPEVHMDSEMIKFAAMLNASLDVDIYVLAEAQPKAEG